MTLASCASSKDVFIPITINEETLFEDVANVVQVIRPSWSKENMTFKIFTDGITNKLVGCIYNNEEEKMVLCRVYGKKTDLLIDRKAELRTLKALVSLGLAPKIYAIFNNGLSYEFFPGDILIPSTVRDSRIWPLIAQNMAKMHKVKMGNCTCSITPMLWKKSEKFLALIPEQMSTKSKQERFVKTFGSISKLTAEFEYLKLHLEQSTSPLVFCHNDLLLSNVIYNEEKHKIYFIDYEYAAYNYQAFDIANHFNEFVGLNIEEIDYNLYPDKDFQIPWLNVYLTNFYGTEPSNEQLEEVYEEVQRFSLASHFFWGIWSIIQYEHSDIEYDYAKYGEIRLSRYYEMKNQILKD